MYHSIARYIHFLNMSLDPHTFQLTASNKIDNNFPREMSKDRSKVIEIAELCVTDAVQQNILEELLFVPHQLLNIEMH